MFINQKGYTFIEFTVVVSVLAILLTDMLSGFVKAREAGREAEVKANLHIIQSALERYATDTGGEYPDYILGGDRIGWDPVTGCRAISRRSSENTRPPLDPLIRFAYLDSYPCNPFLNEGDGLHTIITATGASHNPGDGDVRFGWSGEIMGNCLDDPRSLFDSYSDPTRLKYTMLPVPTAYLGVLSPNGPNSFYCMGGFPQWSRDNLGESDPVAGMFSYYWEGEFFYRSGGTITSEGFADELSSSLEYIWGWPYERVDKYMLGAYGSLQTVGFDVIRLTCKNGRAATVKPGAISGAINGEFYQDHSRPDRDASHPEFDIQVTYSNPEVFGGGECGLMPQFPYYTERDHKWMYGAPDGYPDGIILVLTSELGDDPLMEW